MFAPEPLPSGEKSAIYGALLAQLRAMLEGERDWLANCANTAALLCQALSDLNWAGFYLVRPGNRADLLLGPFQGKPACVRIAIGRGVCGTAAKTRAAVVVADVRDFPVTSRATRRRGPSWWCLYWRPMDVSWAYSISTAR